MHSVSFVLDGSQRKAQVKDNELLLDLLRSRFKKASVKAGCWRGECGLCTVLMNGVPVKSCLVLAPEVDGAHVTTAQGLSDGDRLSPIQKAFVEYGALQCGFCTPAFVLVAHSYLARNPKMSQEEIKEALSGLICRCGSYKQMLDAIAAAAKEYEPQR